MSCKISFTPSAQFVHDLARNMGHKCAEIDFLMGVVFKPLTEMTVDLRTLNSLMTLQSLSSRERFMPWAFDLKASDLAKMWLIDHTISVTAMDDRKERLFCLGICQDGMTKLALKKDTRADNGEWICTQFDAEALPDPQATFPAAPWVEIAKDIALKQSLISNAELLKRLRIA